MKRFLPLLTSVLCVSVALAEPPGPPARQAGSGASELISEQILIPLERAESKRSRFSRAAPVALERRVRVLDTFALADGHGKSFVRFAIDERRFAGKQGRWRRDSIEGCAYPNERQVFVRRGDRYLPARSLFGDNPQERPGACRAAPDDGDAVGSARPVHTGPSAPAARS